MYYEKAKNCEISTLLLSYVVPVKSKVEISQNFMAFLEYINFKSNPLSFLQVPIDSMLSSAQSPGSEKSCNSVELAADKVFRRRDPKNGSGMTSYLSSSFNCVFAQATFKSVRRIIQLLRYQIINLQICSSNL